MKHLWRICPEQPDLTQRLGAEFGISQLLAQCLVNRGYASPEAVEPFLGPRLKSLADPFALPNMSAAVDLLFQVRERAEPMVIFGDYDVDGVTSTAIILEVLGRLGWKISHYLPHRMDEGYGLSRDGVENCLKKFPVKLLLAVDCGSNATATIAWLRERGVEVIVLDHHQVSDPLPAASALVNPQLGSAEPGRKAMTELCSAGLAFKLAHAILKRGRERQLPGFDQVDLKQWLDLVALGTVADLVPLTGENRILVSAGLAALSTTRRPGLVALKTVSAIKGPVGVYETGYLLGPRLNAAGRLETAAEALHLLLAKSLAEAEPLAHDLDACNRERQTIEREICQQVSGAVRARFNPQRDFVIVEGALAWHIGVVGIVASRVLHEFYRPTIILGGDGEAWRGSGRSIEGFDLAAALRTCGDFLLRHGGHAMAAGVTLHPDKLEGFRERLNQIAQELLRPHQLSPSLRLDGTVRLSEVTMPMLEELGRLQPFGQQNPAVQLCARGVRLARAPLRMGTEKQHLKLWLTDGRQTLEAVWWNAANSPLPEGNFDLAFAPQINEFNGNRTVQLKILDWRASGAKD